LKFQEKFICHFTIRSPGRFFKNYRYSLVCTIREIEAIFFMLDGGVGIDLLLELSDVRVATHLTILEPPEPDVAILEMLEVSPELFLIQEDPLPIYVEVGLGGWGAGEDGSVGDTCELTEIARSPSRGFLDTVRLIRHDHSRIEICDNFRPSPDKVIVCNQDTKRLFTLTPRNRSVLSSERLEIVGNWSVNLILILPHTND
jgi:hypothetical protein